MCSTWIGLLVFVPLVARMIRPSVGAAVFIAVKRRSPIGATCTVVRLHRAMRQVMLQAVDDDALVCLQVIAEVRAEVAVDEDDTGGIEG